MTTVATSWLVYRLSGSKLLLGVVGFAGQVPAVLSPFAGVLVDRWNRHRLLVVTQTLAMLQSFALAALALTGAITMMRIIFLALFQGLIIRVRHSRQASVSVADGGAQKRTCPTRSR